MEESCQPNEAIIAYWLRMSRIIISGLFAERWDTRSEVGQGTAKEEQNPPL